MTSLRTLSKQLVFEYLNLIDLLVKNARGVRFPFCYCLISFMCYISLFIDTFFIFWHPQKDEQIEKLRVLFINMHYLLNELRPYEARDNLKLMLKHQLEQRQQAVAEMTSVCDTVAASLAACAPLLNAHVDEKVMEGGDAPAGSVSGSLAGTASASASDALMVASEAEEALERLARIADQLEGRD